MGGKRSLASQGARISLLGKACKVYSLLGDKNKFRCYHSPRHLTGRGDSKLLRHLSSIQAFTALQSSAPPDILRAPAFGREYSHMHKRRTAGTKPSIIHTGSVLHRSAGRIGKTLSLICRCLIKILNLVPPQIFVVPESR